MVYEREDIVGLDGSIIMRPEVWEASGHVKTFTDPLVDCLVCKERFRADKAPRVNSGAEICFKKEGKTVKKKAEKDGYVCPNCGSDELSAERPFNLMFRTFAGPIDPINEVIQQTIELSKQGLSPEQVTQKISEFLKSSLVYLRPETAQAIFVQFLNVQQTMGMKIPFGIAQIGKSFRNEITVEKMSFRSCEFEQMEMEYFVEPGSQKHWHQYWCETRLNWWKTFANEKQKFRLREHEKSELAHYADGCYDVEYEFDDGWGEVEGIASRTDYDLTQHAAKSGVKLSYFDQQKNDPQTGKPGWRYTPYVIEPAAGLTRAVLVFLLDAYCEESGVDADGKDKTRVVLKLHPKLAPYKAAVLPLFKKEGMPELGHEIIQEFYRQSIPASYDEASSIGKRYSRHDEIGTPYCLTVDHQSVQDKTITIRDRDTTKQERIKIDDAIKVVRERVQKS